MHGGSYRAVMHRSLRLLLVLGGFALMPGLGYVGSTYSSDFDQEFNSSPLGVEWTASGGNYYDVNTTVPGALYVSSTSTSQYLWIPSPSMPFTVTARISAAVIDHSNPADVGIGIGAADPDDGYVQIMCPSSYTGDLTARETTVWSSLSVFTDTTAIDTVPYPGEPEPPHHMRITVNSATDIDLEYSEDGTSWDGFHTNFNVQTYFPGWTPGSVILTLHPGSTFGSATWDRIRFTY